jgi:hypothetical protein
VNTTQFLINGTPQFIPINSILSTYYINLIDTIAYSKFNTYSNLFDIKIINIEINFKIIDINRYLNIIDCIELLDKNLKHKKEISDSFNETFIDENLEKIIIIYITGFIFMLIQCFK